MSHTPHELAEEFPHAVEKMQELRTTNPHFARIADEYHRINREIHRAETFIEPMADAAETQLRRQRSALKDEIAKLLAG